MSIEKILNTSDWLLIIECVDNEIEREEEHGTVIKSHYDDLVEVQHRLQKVINYLAYEIQREAAAHGSTGTKDSTVAQRASSKTHIRPHVSRTRKIRKYPAKHSTD